MLKWMIEHYKASIAIFGAVVTIVFVPAFTSSWGFILSTSKTNASVPILEERIIKLEKEGYSNTERFKFIQRALEIIQERDYNELKEARKQRLNKQ